MSETSIPSFLEWLVLTNIQVGVLIIVIVVLQFITTKRLKPGWGYFLWAIVMVRLLMPSPMVIEIPWQISQHPLPHISNQIYSDLATISASVEDSKTGQKISSINSSGTHENSKLILFGIWLIGLVFILTKYLLSLRSCIVLIKRSNENHDPKLENTFNQVRISLNLHRDIKLLISDEIQTPASFGLLKPVVLLPRYALDMHQDQLEMIFAHELIHHKRGDIAFMALMDFVKILHWFNPLVWLAQTKMKDDCELSCDAQATRLFTQDERHRYASLLVSFATQPTDNISLNSVVTMSGSIKTLKNRLISLTENKPINLVQALQIIFSFIIVALTGLTFPVYSSLQTQTIELSEKVEFAMQHISGGSFLMGSADNEIGRGLNESPRHRVAIKPFYVGTHEVTFREWDICVDEGGCDHRSDDYGWGRKNRPVIDVSWNDVQQYINWITKKTGEKYRLPSEAEWEYVARAETTTTYWWGDEVKSGYANCDQCGSLWDDRQTAPVGAFKPNNFGLYDTAGNVWEWVEDCWHKDYVSAPTDGSVWYSENNGDCDVRMVRGGSWDYFPDRLRSAERSSWDANFRYYNFVGFRLAKDI